jgi:hypothetical protein
MRNSSPFRTIWKVSVEFRVLTHAPRNSEPFEPQPARIRTLKKMKAERNRNVEVFIESLQMEIVLYRRS